MQQMGNRLCLRRGRYSGRSRYVTDWTALPKIGMLMSLTGDHGLVRQDQGERRNVQVDGSGWDRHRGERHQYPDYAYTIHLRNASRAHERYRYLLESGRGA